MVTIENGPFTDIAEQPIKSAPGTPDLELAGVIQAFVLSLPREALSMEDCVHGGTVYKQAEATNGVIELEDAEHKWLLGKVKAHGPAFIGISAAKLEKAIWDTP